MFRTNIQVTALEKLHWGDDNPSGGNLKQNLRDYFPVEPRLIKSRLDNKQRERAIIAILAAIRQSAEKEMRKYDRLLAGVQVASKEPSIARFIEVLRRYMGVTTIFDDIIPFVDLMTDEEFLYVVREQPTMLVSRLRSMTSNDEMIFLPIEPGEEKDFFTTSEVVVPIGSANSFRHKIRELLADDYLQRIGKTELSRDGLVLFYNGGSIPKGATDDFILAEKNRQIQEMCPLFGLMGAMDKSFKMTSVLTGGQLEPQCIELGTGLKSAYSLMTNVFGVSGDASNDDRKFDNDRPEKQAMMPYHVEQFKIGTVFNVELGLRPIVRDMPLMHSTIVHALKLLQKDGQIGARNAQASGKIKVEFDKSMFLSDETLYLKHIEGKKNEMLAFCEQF